jgi:two-component system, cell cycle sensor histidine kinase and response regulator CckA
MTSGIVCPDGPCVILLVDDEDMVRQVTRRWLELGGLEVLTAADGAEALAIAERTPRLDLVITDMQMPNMGGRALADRLASLRPELPVLLISGFPQNAPPTSGLGFLAKPFTAGALLKRVEDLLGGD